MFSISLSSDNRILSATYPGYSPNGIIVGSLPEGNIADYKYIDGQYVHDPLPEPETEPNELDKLTAQVTYTAMMTDTLIGGAE